MRQKFRKSVLAAALLAGAAIQANAQVFVPGYLKFESWIQNPEDGTPVELSGANLDDASVLPAIPSFGAPTDTLYMNAFNTRTVYPNDSHENYLARITGVVMVPETGDYHFFLRSDDDGRFYLNKTGETPPDITSGTEIPLIREELDCCDAFIAPGIDTDGDGFGDTMADGVTANTDAEATTITPVHLVAGQKYGITALLKEGGGGDWMEVDVRKVGDTRANAPLPGSFLGTTAPALAITTQPAATTVATENFPVTISVAPGRLQYPGVTYQWRVNGTAIAGATNATYTFSPTLADDNKQYSVVLTGGGTSVTSANSTLDVQNDTTAPTIAAAGTFIGRNAVVVNFSEPIASGLGTAANYTLSGGATVTSAEAIGNTTVLLRTSPLTAGTAYTLTANNLRDAGTGGGNLLSPNTFSFTQVTPPTGTAGSVAEYARWLGATLDGLDDTIAAETPADATQYQSAFESPVDAAEAFTARVRGYFIPPQSGNYVFYGSSDDNGRFYLSTDSDPANKKQIGAETAWSNNREWITSGGGSNLDSKRSDRYANTEWPGGKTISLVGGLPYYIELRFNEGGGGDNGAMTYKLESDPDPASTTPSKITGTNLVWYFDLSQSAPIMTKKPVGKNYNKGDNITLEADAIGATPITFQWFRNKIAIPGATQKTYTISNADHRNMGDYSVEATNPIGAVDTKREDNPARLIMNGATMLIEAEDFNYEGGKHLASVDTVPYLGNAYNGLKPTLDIDFFHDGDNAGGDANAYKYGRFTTADEGTVEIKGPNDPADYNRGSFTVTNNYALGWTTTGEWQNYTRNFKPGKYAVYGGMAHDGIVDDPAEINMILSKVANPTAADGSSIGVEGGGQGLTKVGQFLSPGTGAWSSNDLIPLTDDNGNLVELALGGVQTLRLTFNQVDGDADFMLFYCLDCPADPGGGSATISLAKTGGAISITFTGVLQSSTTVNGTYTDVAGAGSPYTPPGAATGNLFFRARSN